MLTEVRKEHDTDTVKAIINQHLSIPASVSNVTRLGKKSDKPHLRITVATEQDKANILHNCVKIHSVKEPTYLGKVFITPDLTMKEREENKTLRKRLSEMKESNKYQIKKWTHCAEEELIPPGTIKLVSKQSLTFTSAQPSNKHANKISTLTLAVINCQSILAKKPLFENFVSVYKPDIIAGTESWLRPWPDIQNSEIFTCDYQVFRCDRRDGYGGVFLACNKSYSWTEINSYSNCSRELVAFKLEISQGESLIVVSVYRPLNSDLVYLESMCSCLVNLIDDNPNAACGMVCWGHKSPKY